MLALRFCGDSQDEIEVSVIGKLIKEQKWALIADTDHAEKNEEHCCACDGEDHEYNREPAEAESPAIEDLSEDYNQFGN